MTTTSPLADALLRGLADLEASATNIRARVLEVEGRVAEIDDQQAATTAALTAARTVAESTIEILGRVRHCLERSREFEATAAITIATLEQLAAERSTYAIGARH